MKTTAKGKARAKPEKTPFHEEVAAKLIEQIQQGTAPWQKSWKPGEMSVPTNGSTNQPYRGLNAVWLMLQDRDDNRWMTYNQAQGMGAQVRAKERGVHIMYWKTHEERVMRDENHKPVLDEQGQPRKVMVELDQPRAFGAVVFNAEQIDGLPALPPPKREDWDRHAEAEERLAFAAIKHREGDRAFYRPSTDTIHMPGRDQFPDAIAYYQVAFHELGHWTGHDTRLARDLSDPFGSPGYAREELRAEIASVLAGAELGIGHEPRPENAAYVAAWVKRLQEDPKEIMQAAADAQKINRYIMELTKERTQEASRETEEHDAPGPPGDDRERTAPPQAKAPGEKTWLAVPYSEKNAAKALGAKWDFAEKSWYAPDAATAQKCAKWQPQNQQRAEAQLSPREEFSKELEKLGFTLTGEHPIMDGQTHRAPVEGDKQKAESGFYVGHMDGHPAGYATNNRTGEETRWKAKGFVLSEKEKATLAADSAARSQEKKAELESKHEQAAQRVEEKVRKYALAAHMSEKPAYLERKQVTPGTNVFVTGDQKTLFVPGQNIEGQFRTAQYINEDGSKFYAKESSKEGCFHVIGGFDKLKEHDAVVITEGYSTGATIDEAAGEEAAVVCAFDAGNLMSVAMAIKARFPEKAILIAGDDDQLASQKHRGQESARKAAEAVDCGFITPVFGLGEQAADPARFSDFNDLKVHSTGLHSVREQVGFALSKARDRETEKSLGRAMTLEEGMGAAMTRNARRKEREERTEANER